MSYERELEMTADRLRQLPPARLRIEKEAYRRLLREMTRRPVPDIAPQAWGDQLWVIGCEIPEDRREALVDDLISLRRAFDLLP
ncbi:MAG: hypothetical protein U0R23_10100 [Candidatus Nanopelagicales bacterium]